MTAPDGPVLTAPAVCNACAGAGEVGTHQDYWGNWETARCHPCGGTGYPGALDYDEADDANDLGSATTAGVLLALIFGGLLFLAAVHVGQDVMCDLHDDGLRYCDGWSDSPEAQQ